MARRKSPTPYLLGLVSGEDDGDDSLAFVDDSDSESQDFSEQIQLSFENMSLEEVVKTKSIMEDVQALNVFGLIIDYPNGVLESGRFGTVYKGVYGQNASKQIDVKGQPLRNVEPGMTFAAKIVDFRNEGPGSQRLSRDVRNRDIKQLRDAYETEKHIMTFADHRNITPLRMAINMGEPNFYIHSVTGKNYKQHDRFYLIMDLADLGSLRSFMLDNSDKLTPRERISLNKDCFWGLKYIHDNGFAHFDIHLDNVLIFTEDTGIVAKWADFGQSYIGRTGAYPDPILNDRRKIDCMKFSSIQFHIWQDYKPESDYQDLQPICEQFIEMQKKFKMFQSLDQVLNKYENILK